MATKTIDANMLAKMFLAGAQNIEAKKEFINELTNLPDREVLNLRLRF